jgi:ATP-binding cassette subfamily C protein LapB
MAISQAAVVGTIIVGVYQIGAGAMTIGALTASTLLIGRMMAPMSQLGLYLHRLKQVSGSVAIVENVLSAKLESASDPTSQMRALQGLVELRNVSFTYPGEKNVVLSGINLTIKPGERVGVIGRAGSGKSTLMKLLVRLNEIESGAYLLDGHDARQYAPEQIRRHFAYMRQDSLPFDDTLRNVICFGLDRVDEEAFRVAVTVSGVHEFASRHASGYGMRVGPRGERLSGGERQSVMLARILLGQPPAMLLDEPTSSMDNTMEMRLVGDLRQLIGDRTFVVATHRAALLSLVDRLVWLEQGRIVADGPKADVLKKMAAC